MNQLPKISVIVPAYNYGNFLGECLNSLLAQSTSDWECVIIDNGSTDNTADVAKSYAQKDQRFIYVHTPQNGVSFARNKAVELSRGQYILPLDADDKIAPTYLEKAAQVLDKNADIKVVYCDAVLFGAASGHWNLPAYSLKSMLVENAIFCSAMFRKAEFAGFNENMKEGFEDWDFWIRMLKHGEKVYKIPEPLFYYRIKAGSRNSVLDREKQLKLRRQVIANHPEVYAQFFNLADLLFDVYTMDRELAALKNSKEQKLGNAALKPLRAIKKLFGKK